MAAISRRGRYWRLGSAGLGAAVVLYAVAGFWLLPYLAQTALWPWLSRTLGGQVQAEQTRFNPFSAVLTLNGLVLHDAAGQPLLRIGQVDVDVDWLASLRQRALVARAAINAAAVDLAFNAKGQPNFGFLLGKDSGSGSPLPPFMLTELDVTASRLALSDASRGEGYRSVWTPLDIHLRQLGTLATPPPATFTLTARSERQESLTVNGELQLSPALTLNATLQANALALPPLLAWLSAASPYRVDSGTLSASAQLQYSATGFSVAAIHANSTPLSLSQDHQPLLACARLRLEAGHYNHANQQLQLGRLTLDNLSTAAPQPAVLAMLQLQDFGVEIARQRLRVGSIHADGLRLDTPAQQAWLDIAHLKASELRYAYTDQHLRLERLRVDTVTVKQATPVANDERPPRPYRLESVSAAGITLDLARQVASIDAILSKQSLLALWLNPDGSIGASGLPPRTASAAPPPAAAPWQLKLGRVELNDNTVLLRDFTANPPAKMLLANMNLLVKHFDSAAAEPFWLGLNTGLSANGRIALEGDCKLTPLAARLKLYVDDLSLPAFQPYLDKLIRARVVKGTLNMNADLDYAAAPVPALHLSGDVAVAQFASDDKREGRDFIRWKALRVNGLLFDSQPQQRLSIKEIIATEPYVRAIVSAEQTFNLAENLHPPAATATEPLPAVSLKTAPRASDAASLLIGELRIQQASADFADLSLKPTHFAVEINDLNGTIKSLSSRQDAQSDVLLEGKLNQGSTVKIDGKINPFSPQAYADLTMRFSGVNLTTLSPYSAKFAGYRIEKGKLDMDLRYKLHDGLLTAENKFVLDQLTLGERVDSQDATGLPVRMAIALLKDANGKIDLSLPVSGDLSNPDISIRGLLTAAATRLITKVAGSPFSILGSLLGTGSEELDAVKFQPGTAALDTTEKDKLARIAHALRQRPELNLDIKGAADYELDRPALAETDLARHLQNAKLVELGRKKTQSPERDALNLSTDDYSRLFTNLYRWKNPSSVELQTLPTGASLRGEQLENAKRKLLATWAVDEMDLRSLAQQRSESIRNYLVQDLGLPDQRIYLLDVKLSKQDAKDIHALLLLTGS